MGWDFRDLIANDFDEGGAGHRRTIGNVKEDADRARDGREVINKGPVSSVHANNRIAKFGCDVE